MYNFSPCMQIHHGFLMHRCFLDVTVMCLLATVTDDSMKKLVSFAKVDHERRLLAGTLSSRALVWPVCYVVHVLLEIIFGVQLVFRQRRDDCVARAFSHMFIGVALELNLENPLVSEGGTLGRKRARKMRREVKMHQEYHV